MRLWRRWWTRSAITPATLVTFLLVGLVSVSASALSFGAIPGSRALDRRAPSVRHHRHRLAGSSAQRRACAFRARQRGGEGCARQSCPARARAGQPRISGGQLASSRGTVPDTARSDPGLLHLPAGRQGQSRRVGTPVCDGSWATTSSTFSESGRRTSTPRKTARRARREPSFSRSRRARPGGLGAVGRPEGRQPVLGLDVY